MRINVTRSSMPDFEEFCREIRPLWDSHWLTNNGEKLLDLQSRLEAYLDVGHISLFTNGHLALEALLEALDLRGEVITTPFTFASTTHALVRKGLTPVFCDIRQSDYTLDPTLLEGLITERTCAIVPVHVYGCLCDADAIQTIADRHGLKVIYDAAHAFGERVNGVSVAALGDASMFSFHATKVFHTIEGGAAAFSQPWMDHRLNCLKNYGIVDQEHVVWVGGNAKMNEFQAAMGLCNLRHLEEELDKRRRVTERYLENLEGLPGLRLPAPQKDVTPNYAYFPVVFDGFGASRNQVWEALAAQNIFARKYFYPITSQFQCYEGQFPAADTPVALYMGDRVLTLPLYADLALEDVDDICAVIRGLGV